MKFLGLPIAENIDKINNHIAEFNALIVLSDMHIIKTKTYVCTVCHSKNKVLKRIGI